MNLAIILMAFPEFASLKKLESQHPDYVRLAPLWEEIRDLKEGYAILKDKREKYVPRRPNEPLELWNARLQRFVYTPVLANTVREYVSKLVSAPVHIDAIYADFWAELRDSINGKDQDEADFLSQIFSNVLYYGRVFVGGSLPPLQVSPRSAAEDPKVKPYAVVYDPLMVPQWGDDWSMSRKIYSEQLPLEDERLIAEWVFWTPSVVAIYSIPVKLNEDGSISHVLRNDEWVVASGDAAIVPIIKETPHGCDRSPMSRLIVPTELWVGNSVAIKQIQYTQIENGYTDTAVLAGIIQRLFKPSPPVSMDDPRAILQPPTNDALKDMRQGNGYTLIGDSFSFEESSGAALGNLERVLDKIEQQIKELVSKGYSSASGQMAVSQSGVSKEIDQTQVQEAMRQYGKRVARFYQEILGTIAQLAKKSSDLPNVKGLDSYSTDNLKSSVNLTATMLPYWADIPATARKIWVGKIAALMTGSVSPVEEQSITTELEKLAVEFAKEPVTNPNEQAHPNSTRPGFNQTN